MTYNEVRAEALRLMFADSDVNVDIEQDDALGLRVGLSLLEDDENIGPFLKNMRGSVNRCFSVIESKGVLPDRSAIVSPYFDGDFSTFDLPYDCYFPVRLAKYGNDGIFGNIAFERQGGNILIADYDINSTYVLIYKPKIKRLFSGVDDFEELDLPENVASFIPFYIKGELFRDEEPNEASEARNWFEAAMSELMTRQDGEQRSVEAVFGGDLL